MKQFFEHCSRNLGIRGLPAINVRPYKQGLGWGVEAARDLKAGELILSIPKKAWRPTSAAEAWETIDSEEKELSQRLINFAKNKNMNLMEKPVLVGSTVLSLHVLRELKNKSSKSKDYLSVIPKELGSLPLFWNNDQMARLQNSPVRRKVEEQRNLLLDIYSEVVEPHFKEDPNFGAANFAWSYSLLLSRAVSSFKDQIPFGLVPVLDFFNHCTPSSYAGYCMFEFNHEDESYHVVSTVDVAKGQQLFISYGKLCNGDLLRKYGFCVPHNPYNTVSVDGIVGTGIPAKFVCNMEGEIDVESSSNETQVDDYDSNIMRRQLETFLNRYGTSLEDDITKLMQLRAHQHDLQTIGKELESDQYAHIYALLLRIGEKETLKACLEKL
eukprot:CAMPEP_0184049508 /NCGR_PEP_ID=MMETSP0956-20121227/3469_1 /TAXON_ID=627963 /ORGANISM="Aplanochytrium sp, Strain PBS07" /LENGTH=382 /DNA_ID=CAMNT_0026341847 /DNA_START=165 /DNA_END=1313 /DNA_ORIENTATION=-